MDNSYSKGEMNNNQPETVKSVPIKMPKNLRQVGSVGSRNKVIYIEDYVMTYIKQLSDKEYSGCRVAVLMGYYVKTDTGKSIFVKGAVEMPDTDFTNGIVLTDEGWTSVYENIKNYFSDSEIVGWCLIGPGFFIESEEKIQKVHMENFQGKDKILLKLDSLEKEESFYIYENNKLVRQTGYYIYYEKNEEMQNYMVDNKEGVSEEKDYDDQATRKIRNVIQEKKEMKDDKSVIRLLYAASTLLAIIVLVIAATMLDNYDKMRSMETAINKISESLNLKEDINSAHTDNSDNPDNSYSSDIIDKADNQSDDNTDKTGKNQSDPESDHTPTGEEEHADMDKNNDSDKKTEVETVKGNVQADPDANDPEEDEQVAGSKKNNDNKSNNGTESANNDGNNQAQRKDKTEDNEDAVEASAPVKYYVVQPGDSLAAISFQLYHTFSYIDEIKELNGIEDENKIYVGQKLIVP